LASAVSTNWLMCRPLISDNCILGDLKRRLETYAADERNAHQVRFGGKGMGNGFRVKQEGFNRNTALITPNPSEKSEVAINKSG
jgi:hypothetical protein